MIKLLKTAIRGLRVQQDYASRQEKSLSDLVKK